MTTRTEDFEKYLNAKYPERREEARMSVILAKFDDLQDYIKHDLHDLATTMDRIDNQFSQVFKIDADGGVGVSIMTTAPGAVALQVSDADGKSLVVRGNGRIENPRSKLYRFKRWAKRFLAIGGK